MAGSIGAERQPVAAMTNDDVTCSPVDRSTVHVDDVIVDRTFALARPSELLLEHCHPCVLPCFGRSRCQGNHMSSDGEERSRSASTCTRQSVSPPRYLTRRRTGSSAITTATGQ